MPRILLINPNSSRSTTATMQAIAQEAAPNFEVVGRTVDHGPSMILDEAGLAAAEPHVIALALCEARHFDGIIISAFGDPGLGALRRATGLPVVGICEESMRAAAAEGRRFGIATVTPGLVDTIRARATDIGLGPLCVGTRLTTGDPEALVADPAALEDALFLAVEACARIDGAEAVVIGGGPLGLAAPGLARRSAVPIIAPIPAAMARLKSMLRR